MSRSYLETVIAPYILNQIYFLFLPTIQVNRDYLTVNNKNMKRTFHLQPMYWQLQLTFSQKKFDNMWVTTIKNNQYTKTGAKYSRPFCPSSYQYPNKIYLPIHVLQTKFIMEANDTNKIKQFFS